MFDTSITFRKIFGHLKTILVHKYWVFYYCCKLGIPWRGFKHDMSKFSPVEFWESVRYWDGKSSPIPRAKLDKGYSLAWQHHKGHNTHHYEYWVDWLDKGGIPIKMPWYDLLELVADWLGAGRAYQGKDFTLKGEYEFVLHKFMVEQPKIHETTAKFISYALYRFAEDPDYIKTFRSSLYKDLWKDRYENSN